MSNTFRNTPMLAGQFTTQEIELLDSNGNHLAQANLTNGMVTFTAIAPGYQMRIKDNDGTEETHIG